MFIENKCWQSLQFLLYLHTLVNKLLGNVCQRIKTSKRSRQSLLCLLDCMHFYDQCNFLQISSFLVAQSSGLKSFNLMQYWGIYFQFFSSVPLNDQLNRVNTFSIVLLGKAFGKILIMLLYRKVVIQNGYGTIWESNGGRRG